MKTTAVIMAGGKGERFWPRSRSSFPKQFLSLTNDKKTMIQLTVDRISSLVEPEDIYISTNTNYVDIVKNQLPQIPAENILAEPIPRNTAPCIGFAASVISRKYDDAIMMVLPSDHLIRNTEIYLDTLNTAIEVATDGDNLVTIGITPTYPETGYGYIHFSKNGPDNQRRGVYKVRRFVEKPHLDLAKEYLASGNYLWNSGQFVWKISTIRKNFERLIPNTFNGLLRIREAYGTVDYDKVLCDSFQNFKSESIDYAIMEHADNIYTIPGNFGWDDVGSWLALERFNRADEHGNIIQGDVVDIDSKNNIICGNDRTIAVVGLENIVIIQTDDAILVCSKDSVNDIKKVVNQLKVADRTDLL